MKKTNHFTAAFLLCALSVIADGEGSLLLPDQLKHAEIKDMAGAKLPLDVMLTNQDGHKISLGYYFTDNDKRPVILTLGYYGCPRLCSLVTNGLVEVLKKISLKPSKDYRIISVSIDDREQADLAKQKQDAYLASMDSSLSDNKWWQFHVSDESSARKIADAVGFDFFYDKKTDQFAHGAGFFIISPDGTLSRTLYGISFKPEQVKLALIEASEGKIGSFVDRVILSCFHYDPDSHRYGVYIMGVMRLGGIITVLLIGIFILMHVCAERRRYALHKVTGHGQRT